jgi:hypothetical protein
MIRPALPNELYHEIFSNLGSSSSDLFHVVLASRTFCTIARPLLYQHITITTSQQRERLKEVREEDKRLVKKVTIKGDGSIDTRELMYHFGNCSLGERCVEDLLTGALLDISGKHRFRYLSELRRRLNTVSYTI